MEHLLMSKNQIIARIDEKGNFIWKNEKLLPLYFLRTENLNGWLASRAIDPHRANSRLLKRALRMEERDDVSTARKVNAVTVTDTYWMKEADSELTWEDVCFKKDYFSSLALKGNYGNFVSANASRHTRTQELTNIGSFEKCWRIREGVWWLYKQADANELFSEYFISLFGRKLGFYMAEYVPGNDYIRPKVRFIRTRDFTNGASVNFEPLDAIMGDYVEDYRRTYHVLEQFGKEFASDYVSILFMDTICANPDRHSFNLGVLRDVDTGEILRLAPNFDNNMALISRGYPARRKGSDLLIRDFNELLEEGIYWSGYSEKKTLPAVTPELVKETIVETGMRVRTQEITEFICNRFSEIHW